MIMIHCQFSRDMQEIPDIILRKIAKQIKRLISEKIPGAAVEIKVSQDKESVFVVS